MDMQGRKNIDPPPFWVLDWGPVIKDRLTREKQTCINVDTSCTHGRHLGKSEVPTVAWNPGLNTILIGKEERHVDL